MEIVPSQEPWVTQFLDSDSEEKGIIVRGSERSEKSLDKIELQRPSESEK